MENQVDPNKVRLRNVRGAFVTLNKAKPYEEGQKPYFTLDVLLDPSIKEHAVHIAQIKEIAQRVATEEYGSTENIKNLCFGKGDNRVRAGTDEVYDGYAGMFYLKLKAHADKSAAGAEHFGLVGNRSGKLIAPGDPQWPYSGCYLNVSASLWALSKKSKHIRHGKTIGGNLLTVQFVRDGEAFGGTPVNVEDEFEVLDDNAPAAVAAGGSDDWDL